MKKKVIILLSIFAILNGQHNHEPWVRCNTDELEKDLQFTNPEFFAKKQVYIDKAQRLLEENPQWRTNNDS